MGNPALTFRAAQDAALRASSALEVAMIGTTRLYVEVPTNAPLPYVVVGQDEIEPLDEGCGEAFSIVSTVQWWATISGAVKGSTIARQMGAAILEALYAELAIEGYRTVLCAVEEPLRYSTDPDQSTRGRVALRYELEAE